MEKNLDSFCGRCQGQQNSGSEAEYNLDPALKIFTKRLGIGKGERELKVTGDSCLGSLQGRISRKQIMCPNVIFTDGS